MPQTLNKERIKPGSQTAQRALQILKLLGRNNVQGLTAQEIVLLTGAERSAVRRALAGLVEEGLAQRGANAHSYHLGIEAMHLGRATIRSSPLTEQYQFALQRIARLTGDTVFLTTRVGDFIVCVFRDEGSTAVRAPRTRPGDFRVMGTTAGGMAILATLPDEDIRQIHARHEAAFNAAHMDFATLRRNVAMARRAGYSVLSNNVSDGVTSIGVCLPSDSEVFSAASIAAAHARMSDARIDEVRKLLQELHVERTR
jgi:DNA-binding IclR family transcriptional regulator